MKGGPVANRPSPEQERPVLAYERRPQDVNAGGWILVPLDTFAHPAPWFPPYCCVCLQHTPEHWRLPIVFPIRLVVPICRDCRKRYERKSRSVILGSLVIASLIASAFVMAYPQGSSLLSIAACALTVLICTSFTAFLAAYFTLPIRVGFWMRGMTTIWIRFRNPGYVLLMDRAAPDPEWAAKFQLPRAALTERAARCETDTTSAKDDRRGRN